MPRPARIHCSGAFYHVMSRGNKGQNIFYEDHDWRLFLRLLKEIKAQSPFRLLAYCLMPNHFHLLIQVQEIPLSLIMQRLLTRFAQIMNTRRQMGGHIFQARYKAILCDKDSYLLELLRYIHLNPVRAGLVSDPAAWNWSGHREYLDPTDLNLVDIKWPLSIFAADFNEAKQLYQQFVTDGLTLGHDERFYRPTSTLSLATAPSEASPTKTGTLDELAREISHGMNLPLETLMGPSRIYSTLTARRKLVYAATERGFTLSEVATYLKRSPSTISRILLRLNPSAKSAKPDPLPLPEQRRSDSRFKKDDAPHAAQLS